MREIVEETAPEAWNNSENEYDIITLDDNENRMVNTT